MTKPGFSKIPKRLHERPGSSARSTPGYLKQTIESRNKQKIGIQDQGEEEKKKPPLISPRLCQGKSSPTFSDIKNKVKRHYHPEDYDDKAQQRQRDNSNETYLHVQSIQQDRSMLDECNTRDHKPRPPSGDPSLRRPRKERHFAPPTCEEFEKNRKEAERRVNRAKKYDTLWVKNVNVKDLQTELDSKTDDLDMMTHQLFRLNNYKSKYYSVKDDNKKVWKMYSDLKRKLEDTQNELDWCDNRIFQLENDLENKTDCSIQHNSMKSENALLKAELGVITLKAESQFQEEKANLEREINKLTQDLQIKDIEIESLVEHRERERELSKKCTSLQKEKENAESRVRSLSRDVRNNEFEIRSLNGKLEQIHDLKKQVKSLHEDNDVTNDKKKCLQRALEEKEREVKFLNERLKLSKEINQKMSENIKGIEISKKQTVDVNLMLFKTENDSLKSDLENTRRELEEFSKKWSALHRNKEEADAKISALTDALYEKNMDVESLTYQLERAKENVSVLSKEIEVNKESKRQVADELQVLQTENASLKSALSKATNEIKDLLNKDTNLQKYKTDTEHTTSTLMNALQDKETEIKALSKQLARSEENVSILSKDIQDIQQSKRQVADEKLQDLQTENDSLKLTLVEATTKIDDLWNKCTNLQKYKSDTELEIGTLLNALEEKETEIETLHQHLARSEKDVSILSKDIKDIQGSKRQAADEKVQSLQTENASLKLELAKASTDIDAFRNQCTNLQKHKTDTEHMMNTLLNAVKEKETEFEALNKQLARKNNELSKDKENAENQKNRLSKALDEKEKEIEIMQNDIARYNEKIRTLTKTVEDIKGSKNQAADENIKGLQKKIGSLESELRNATSEMNDLSYKYKCLQKDKESAEYTINKLSRNVQEKEKEINSLIEDLAKSNDNVDREEHTASANTIQKLKDENGALKLKLSQLSLETEKKISALTKEIKSLQKSKGTSSEEYNARKLYEENEFLKAQLDRTSRGYEQLRKDYNEVKREKDHALNRLSSVAGEKLRNNNPGIADLSDENRPINLGEKFSQLYDDQWTDAIEHLEEMGFSETDGIRRLLDILKAVFDECVRLSDTHFNQLKELTGTSHLPSDQLKKLKDLRKATAVHSVAKIKQVVNEYMSTAFSKEKAACQTYIDRSIELCWLMSVQDPPVVIDFIAVHGQAIDDKILRKFTKTGSKIDFLVWPVIRLHKNGPLLQKGVVQPI